MTIQDTLNFLALQDPSSGFSKSVTEDIDGTVLERLEYIANRSGAGAKRIQGAGYTSLPAAPAGQVTLEASGTPGADGSYVQIRAASGNAIYIYGMMFHDFNATAATYDITLATGGAGAESVICGPITITDTTTGPAGMYYLPFASPIEVAASTRIAARCSCSTGSSTLELTLVVAQKTDLVNL